MGAVRLHTFGCKLNYAETSTFARQFAQYGYSRCASDGEADVIVVNSCAVTEHAQRKCRQLLRRVRRENAGAFLVVTGCYGQLSGESLLRDEGVDIVIARDDKSRLAELTLAAMRHEGTSAAPAVEPLETCGPERFFPAYSIGERTRAFLKVQDGCSYRCTYCTIPAARGASRSPSVAEVVRQAEEIAARGVREIVLTGVNTGDFGRGGQERFVDLLRALERVEGIARYRISSIEPNLLNDEVLDFVAGSSRFLPHLHVPLQSGSASVLRAMGRRYTPKMYWDRVAAARRRLPDLFLGVDVIVGFPGEGEAEFGESYAFLESLGASYLHVFPYSRRPGTLAAAMEGQVDEETKRARVQQLSTLCERQHQAYRLRFVGDRRRVLVERVAADGCGEGLTDNYLRVAFGGASGLRGREALVELSERERAGMIDGKLVEIYG